jgi:hypothetical protein
MEPEGSLPCSQEPSTGIYPEPDESSAYQPILSKIQINIILPATHDTITGESDFIPLTLKFASTIMRNVFSTPIFTLSEYSSIHKTRFLSVSSH